METGTKFAGDIRTRPVPEEETEGLNEKHHRKDNAHGSRRLRVDLPHKKGIGHVVETRHEH